ncbi:hypothetical protein GCM10011428_04780 [Streptomyces violaceus]
MCSSARVAGYRSALASAGVRHRAEYVRHAGFDESLARRRTLELLDLPEPPTAVFVCSDRMALGVYQALAERELRVPDDVSVVGFDDLPEARWASPGLTTVRQPLSEMAATALRSLLRMMDGHRPESSTRTELSTRAWWNGEYGGARRGRRACPTQVGTALPGMLFEADAGGGRYALVRGTAADGPCGRRTPAHRRRPAVARPAVSHPYARRAPVAVGNWSGRAGVERCGGEGPLSGGGVAAGSGGRP